MDKDYYLTRSKSVLGSVLSKKEILQFDLNSINQQSSDNSLEVSYFIDKEGDTKPYIPISLRVGTKNEKDDWYYYSLLGYTIKRIFFLCLLAINILLGAKIFSFYNDSPFIRCFGVLSILIAIVFFVLF